MCWIHGGYIAGWASKPICLLPKVQHSLLCPQISWDTPNPLADHVKKKMPIGHWVEPILRPNDQIIHEISHYFRNINHLYIDDHIWSPCLSFLFCQLSTFVTRRQLSASSETCPQLRASPHRVPLIMSLRIQQNPTARDQVGILKLVDTLCMLEVLQGGAPKIAFSWFITPITMVYRWYIYS